MNWCKSFGASHLIRCSLSMGCSGAFRPTFSAADRRHDLSFTAPILQQSFSLLRSLSYALWKWAITDSRVLSSA